MRLLVLLLVTACAGARPPPADPLADLNHAARAAYADARSRALQHAGPVLIVGPAHVTLLANGARSEMELTPPRYHELKSMAHLALGLHSLFFESQGDPARLAELRKDASAALDALQGLTPEQLQRQREIVRLSLGVNGPADLPAYERAVAPLLLANAVDAAQGEIDDLDKAVDATRRTLGDDFARLHVIVVGAHMAREGEISMQYFEKLLGEREGLRLVFAEGVWDEPGELQLLGTHILDASVGEGFFRDPRRMHRDLLSDAAAQVLGAR